MAIGEPPWPISGSDETSRGRASCSSEIAASIVGTTSVAVTPLALDEVERRAGSNAGSTTWRPPFHTVASTAIEPAAWNSGAMISQRVSGRERRGGQEVDRVGHEVAVGEHHALGRAGRAARVEQPGEVVLADVGQLGGSAPASSAS